MQICSGIHRRDRGLVTEVQAPHPGLTGSAMRLSIRERRDGLDGSPENAFESFSATPGELGIDIAKMKNILSMINKGDAITLSLPEGGQKLEISFRSYRYSITLLDANTIRKDPNPPTIELPGIAVIAGDTLNNAIKAAAVVSDKIALGIDPKAETFYMSAEGDIDHIKLQLGKDELKTLKPAEARSLFSLDYLKDMGKVMGKAPESNPLGIDQPREVQIRLCGRPRRAEYLAPRIEAD